MGQNRQEELEQGYREEWYVLQEVRSIREGNFGSADRAEELYELIYQSYNSNHFSTETERGLTPQDWLNLEVGCENAKEKFCKVVTEQDLINFVRKELV